MANNGLATLYDDAGNAVASTKQGKGNALYGALCVSDNGVAILVSSGGAQTAAPIAAGTASDTVVKASAGRLARISVTAAAGTTTGTTAIYDNASGHTGTILVVVPNNTAVGTILDVQMPAANGITVNGGANSPGMTISYI